ncbi:hypothetical protein ES702_07844 [subsurface metagenome]
MKPLTLEYIAGFVDGEGSFTIARHKEDSYIPHITIGNTNLKIVQDIQKYFSIGLKIYTRHPKNPKHKVDYQLVAQTIDTCKSVAALLEPYLRIKKEQAQIFMQYPRSQYTSRLKGRQKDFSTKSLQQKLRNRIMALNKRGRPIQGANEDLQPEQDPQLNLFNLNQKEVLKPSKGAN